MKRVETRAGPYALPLAIRGHGTLYIQAAWTVGAISDDRRTRWRCTGRRKDVRSGHGRRQLIEMRSDSTAARHGDVPTDLDPPYGSARLPSHLPGDLPGEDHEARGSV